MLSAAPRGWRPLHCRRPSWRSPLLQQPADAHGSLAAPTDSQPLRARCAAPDAHEDPTPLRCLCALHQLNQKNLRNRSLYRFCEFCATHTCRRIPPQTCWCSQNFVVGAARRQRPGDAARGGAAARRRAIRAGAAHPRLSPEFRGRSGCCGSASRPVHDEPRPKMDVYHRKPDARGGKRPNWEAASPGGVGRRLSRR